MLLTRLVEYANASSDIPPPFYALKPVRWIVELRRDGSLAATQLTPLADPSDRATRNGVRHLVPSVQRTGPGSAPALAADTAEYALGWASEAGRLRKAAQYHAAFRDLVARWRAAAPNPAAAALHRFFSEGHAAGLVRPAELAGNHLVAFRCGGEFVHQTEAAMRFWVLEATGRKGSDRTGVCLVCGQVGGLLQTIPQQLPARLVPGATQSAALVSFNKAPHGFDLQKQLVYSPICVRCGLQAMSALERLLDGTSSTPLPGQDTRLAWWVTRGATLDLDTLEDPNPARVTALLGSAARAVGPAPLDGDGAGVGEGEDPLAAFCAVTVGGNIARVMVRDWIELPLREIRKNLGRWFADHEMVDAWTGEPRYVAVGRLAMASGRWIRGRPGQKGAYARFSAPGADRPGGLQRALLATALRAKPLPPKLLAHLVYRIRTDGRVDTERAALVRLALRRRPATPDPEAYMPSLNPDNNQPAYLAGRLFAVLDELQGAAVRARGDDPLSVTFSDRYFGRAVTSPAVALIAGRRSANAWLKRLRRDKPGWANAYDQRLDDLFARLAAAGGPPHGALLADQSAFILGFHQERAAARAARAARADRAAAATQPTTTAAGTDS